MKVIKDSIGKTTVYIQAIGSTSNIVLGKGSELPIKETGRVSKKLESAYEGIKETINSIAVDIGTSVAKVEKKIRPQHLEMEFNIGLSVEGKAGIDKIIVIGMSGKEEFVFKVKMVWDL